MKRFLGLQDFVSQANWLDDAGRPFSSISKRKILAKMNSDSESDLAGITYCSSSDAVEMWYAMLNRGTIPFQECGFRDIIPGFGQKIQSAYLLD